MTLADSMAGAGESGQALLEQLCEVSIALWKGRLREGVTVEDCGSAFICAAAFTAAAEFALGHSGSGAESFTAGEISVKGRAAAETAALAKNLRQAAAELMAPYTTASADFAFLGVQG